MVDGATVLVAVDTLVDAWSQAQCAAQTRRRGPALAVADRAVRTVAILCQGRGNAARPRVRNAAQHGRAAVPGRRDHRTFTCRVRTRTGVRGDRVPRLAAPVGAALAPAQVREGVPVPVPVARRDRGLRPRRCGDAAGIGGGGTDRDGYDGGDRRGAATDGGGARGVSWAPPPPTTAG